MLSSLRRWALYPLSLTLPPLFSFFPIPLIFYQVYLSFILSLDCPLCESLFSRQPDQTQTIGEVHCDLLWLQLRYL